MLKGDDLKNHIMGKEGDIEKAKEYLMYNPFALLLSIQFKREKSFQHVGKTSHGR